jgi:RimJ/RimL family protein N-acetyltransferase
MFWPVPADTQLTGSWVRLAPLDPDADAPALFAALDHDAVWKHLAGRPDSRERLAETLFSRHAEPAWQQWLVRTARPVAGLCAGDVIGTTSYLEVSPEDARLEIGATAYTPAAWGTTVNPEAKLLLLNCAFGRLRAGRVQLKTDVRNIRSQRAIARLGARYEGTLRRYQRRSDGSVRDTALFSIIAEDWPSVRRRLEERLARSGQPPPTW